MTISKGGLGQYVLIFELLISNMFGLKFDAGTVESALNATIVALWSQFSRSDLYLGLIRKKL